MIWSNRATSFGFPVFVIWRTLTDDTRKPRVVVDVRGLNVLSIPDSYPLPRQDDILNFVRGAKFIFVVDAAQFFYQWAMHPELT